MGDKSMVKRSSRRAESEGQVLLPGFDETDLDGSAVDSAGSGSHSTEGKPVSGGRVIERDFSVEMRTSYLEYARNVIVDRAIPDVRDGLKPVQRRILNGMLGLGLDSGEYKKSARIVGEVMGKYHPHGDSSIYEAMARLAQDFSLRTCLVDGQGNFGSLDGDSPAAMRYTEARLTSTGSLMLAGINENAVDFVPNFDDSLTEPSVLPAPFPNLIVNGTSGIAVGMATSMPGHNPIETLNALSYRLENPTCSIDEILSIVPGPDFPTGAIVAPDDIKEIYSSGRGKFRVRAPAHIEENGKRKSIVVTEIPFATNKSAIVASIASALEEAGVDGVVAVRDESGREGIRIVVELLKRVDANAVLAFLYGKTLLETTFPVANLALDIGEDGIPRPKVYSFPELLDAFTAHRLRVLSRVSAFRLDKAKKRLHIVEGLIRATDIIDDVIAEIRKSSSIRNAMESLVSRFGFTEIQSEAILDMKLQRLVSLRIDELRAERDELLAEIAKYEKLLSDQRAMKRHLIAEWKSISATLIKKFPDGIVRRTKIEPFAVFGRTSVENGNGKSSRLPVPSVSKQERVRIYVDENDAVSKKTWKRGAPDESCGIGQSDMWSDDDIVCITSSGRAYRADADRIPDASKGGRPASGVFDFPASESVLLIAGASKESTSSVVFVSPDGGVKRMSMAEISGIRNRDGRRVFPEDGKIFACFSCGEEDRLAFVTKDAKFLAIRVSDIQPKGRSAGTIAGMKIGKDDEILTVFPWSNEVESFVIETDNGFVRRMRLCDELIQGRGGKGMYCMRNGGAIGRIEWAGPINAVPDRPEYSTLAIGEVQEHSKKEFSRIDELEKPGEQQQSGEPENVDGCIEESAEEKNSDPNGEPGNGSPDGPENDTSGKNEETD